MAQPTQTGFFNAWLASMQGANWNTEQGTSDFLDDFIAPSFGYDPNMDKVWGNEAEEDALLSESSHVPYFPQFDWTNVEAAEEEFYETIGSVPTSSSGFNPFDWETLAHLDPAYADSLISGYSTGTSQEFGGNIGSQYGIDMHEARTTYIESARTERESLRKDTKTLYSKMGHQSGTSGAILKSGEAFSNIGKELKASEKSSETIGRTFKTSTDSAFADFDQDLNQALVDYLGVISDERQIFFQDTMVAIQQMGVTLDADGSGEGIFSGDMGQDMPEDLLNALTPPEEMPSWWDSDAGEEYVPAPGEGYVQCANGTVVQSYEDCPEWDPTYYEDNTAQLECHENGGSWDYMKGDCEYPTGSWLAGEEVQCGEDGGTWNWGTSECDMPDLNEEGGFTFDAWDQTWDVICPEGWTQENYAGTAGCCPPGGCTQGSGAWTEQGELGSQVSDEDYAIYEQYGSDFTYEEWFGGPTDAGYTDYYCYLHPNNPACESVGEPQSQADCPSGQAFFSGDPNYCDVSLGICPGPWVSCADNPNCC